MHGRNLTVAETIVYEETQKPKQNLAEIMDFEIF